MRRSWLDYVPVGCYLFSAVYCVLVAGGMAYGQTVPGTGAVVSMPTTVSGGLSGSRTAFGSLVLQPSTWQPAEIRMAGDGLVTKVNSTLVRGAVPVQVTGLIPKATVAAALGRFALKGIPLLSTGVALYDLANELDYRLLNTPTGIAVTKSQPGGGFQTSVGGGVNSIFSTVEAACAAHGPAIGLGPNTTVTYCELDVPTGYFYANYTSPSYGYYSAGIIGALVTGTPTVVPSTLQAFTDSIVAKTGWPSGSALPRATLDAVKSGESIESPTEAVTGPATSPGGSTVTTDPVANTTNTSTTTNNYSYAGDTVTTTQTTTNVTVNNSTGAVTNNTTTTTNPAPPEPLKVCGLPGGPACKIDEGGTPPPVPPNQYAKAADDYKSSVDSNRETMGGAADKPFFTGWSVFFSAPAVAACVPFQMPHDMPAINPCGVVDGVRLVMGYLWALAALYWCVGMIREST